MCEEHVDMKFFIVSSNSFLSLCSSFRILITMLYYVLFVTPDYFLLILHFKFCPSYLPATVTETCFL